MSAGREGELLSVQDHEPHTGALARLLLEHGEQDSALRVCLLWRDREPGNPEIARVESDARRGGIPRRPLPVDQQLAERYVQAGYLAEAAEIYLHIDAAGGLDQDGAQRRQVLEEFTRFELPVDADPAQISAEEHIAGRRLPSALLDYRDLARRFPTDEGIIRRADQLRSIVLGVPPSVQASRPADLGETTEMPLPTQALLMLKEANLRVAAQLFAVMSKKEDAEPLVVELASAIGRLAELTTNDPLTGSSDDEGGTARLGPQSFAAFHVRVGNFHEAAELYKRLVERRPASQELRQRLDDIRTVLTYLRVVEGGPEPQPSDGKKKRKKRATSPGLGLTKAPDPKRGLFKRSGAYELDAFRPPREGDEASGASPAPFGDDPTKRVDKMEIAEIQLSRGFIDRALILFDELLAERPDDEELRARVESLRERFGKNLYEEESEDLATQVDSPAVGTRRKDESRPKIDTEAMVDALKGVPSEAEPARSAASWLPTQRVQAVDPDALPRPSSEVLRRAARTQLTRPPTVEEIEGQSLVEVPKDVASVVERTPGRIDADEAAEVAEPLGVAVRPILLIE